LIWHVSEKKIRAYLLNAHHRDGRSKARFFIAHGYSDREWHVLAQAIGRHPVDNPIAGVEATTYGQKLVVVCRLRTPDGRNPCIRTVWIAEAGANPRLVTAYPFA